MERTTNPLEDREAAAIERDAPLVASHSVRILEYNLSAEVISNAPMTAAEYMAQVSAMRAWLAEVRGRMGWWLP
jgi:hypothetical protein